MIRVKACCIRSPEEARTAIRLGADALGLVSEMPSGPGILPDSQIAEITAGVPADVDTFLLTCRTTPESIVEQHARCGTTTIQLCDSLATEAYVELRMALPAVKLVQVVHVAGPEAVAAAARVAGLVDALLLDSGNPALPVRELGGTGRTHDWGISARVVAASPVPVWLAGGLNASNVGRALGTVRPQGIDVCSGVRTDGRLDPARLEALVVAVRAGADGPTP